MFGPEYTKIQTAFKRDERNVIIPGEWTLPEFRYLSGKENAISMHDRLAQPLAYAQSPDRHALLHPVHRRLCGAL